MLQYEQIIPECYVDTNFIGSLLDANVNHRFGCTNVAGLMNGQMRDRFAVGIIDHDKVKLTYLNEFRQLACRTLKKQKATDKDVCIHLYRHQSRPHYLITIEKAIEKFVLRCAALSGVKMEDYKLPSSFEALLEVTKHKGSNKDKNLQRLFRALLDAGNTDLLALQGTLNYFVKEQKNVNEQELKQIFLS